MHIFKSLNLKNMNEEYGLKEIQLSKMNIFVGSNNSGKSRLVRSILNYKNESYEFKNNDFLELKKVNDIDIKNMRQINSLSKWKGHVTEEYLHLETNYSNEIEPLKKIREYLEKTTGKNQPIGQRRNTMASRNKVDEKKVIEDIIKIEESISKEDVNKNPIGINLIKKYIPTLRGLREISGEDFYKKRTLEDYFCNQNLICFGYDEREIKEKIKLEIITGLEMYDKCAKMLHGSSEARKKMEKFENFLSEEFFEGEDLMLMPIEGSSDLHIKIGDAKDFPVSQLGDGIQSMIILTFPLFENAGKYMLIGIEEPEIYLHPGAQRKLMEVLLDKGSKYGFENFQYLITTHSNHFLDLTLDYPEDIIIYESKKVKGSKFEITRKNDNNMLELMDSLGIRNSSVFLANSTIWVEGITDRLYLKEYMKVYQRELFHSGTIKKIYEEDKHYSFVEYSGGNITHWDFLDEEEGMTTSKISNNVFLIADTDGHRDKPTKTGKETEKSKRIKKLESLMDISTYLLECKEIENLLTPRTIKEILKEKGEKVNSLNFNQDAYKDEGIGKYIENTLLNRQEDKKKYEAESGTIKDKVNFCRLACNHIKGLDDLSEETQKICKKLYDFIARANGDKV